MTQILDIEFNRAYGASLAPAQIKQQLMDFQVTERLGWEPEGEGEHIYLELSKRGENTAWVAKQLAQFAGVNEKDIGYAGLKDRQAQTQQWFSIYHPREFSGSWEGFAQASKLNVSIEQITRGLKKIRRGSHRSNRFLIVARTQSPLDVEGVNERLKLIKEQGVPNYFGEQRFGRERNNLVQASTWVTQLSGGKPKRNKTFVLSAARSLLFNLVLSQRVESGCWDKPIVGDVCIEGLPSAPLWGRGRPQVADQAAELEMEVLQQWQPWCNALEHAGLSQERRACVLLPQEFTWTLQDSSVSLEFELAAGCFATSVLQEIFDVRNGDSQKSLD